MQVLGLTKAKMESLMLGVPLKIEGKPVWDDRLNDEDARNAIGAIAAGVGGYIRADLRRHVVLVFGPDQPTIDSVDSLLVKEISSFRQSRRSIPLSPLSLSAAYPTRAYRAPRAVRQRRKPRHHHPFASCSD